MALPFSAGAPWPSQLTLELGHVPAQSQADFLVGEGNALAYGRIMAFPQWPDPITLLIGPPKSGKSHLSRIFADHSGAHLVSLHDLEAMAKQGGRSPIILEDVDQRAFDEAGLFHLLNQALRDQRPLLLTAREDVSKWPLTTADVRSRIRRAAVFTLEMTDDIQLSQMFVKLFGDRQIRVDPRIVAYLVARMERSSEEVVALSELLDRLALSKGSAITRSIAAEALEIRRAARGDGITMDRGLEDDE
jgi:chromosomal replication initiation ATPase DnaA